MDIFVARQPILTREEQVYGYELLYRNSLENSFTDIDGDFATTELLFNSFLGIGNENISQGKKLFINFTRNLLIKRVPCLFSPEKVIIEVLENVDGDEEVLAALAEFKAKGFTIALDDFLLKQSNKNLLPYADIIKVDFLHTSSEQRKNISQIAHCYNTKLLAEKIETRLDFELAYHEGYTFFQGYFFSKPVIVSTTDIPFHSYSYVQILAELMTPEPDIDKIASLIEYDLPLSYKLLKIVNQTGYYTEVKITSIKQAIVILGLNELIRWITILTLKQQKPLSPIAKEILHQSLIRGKFAELFGTQLFGPKRKAECFMLGMFSLLDGILQRPMKEILEKLPLSDAVKAALLKDESELSLILEITEAIEHANWEKLNSSCVSSGEISKSYQLAIKWTNQVFESIE